MVYSNMHCQLDLLILIKDIHTPQASYIRTSNIMHAREMAPEGNVNVKGGELECLS